ncbi:MAG: hypothetical protein V3V92_03495 [Candidatus Hydrothermarchaeales archaeon]
MIERRTLIGRLEHSIRCCEESTAILTGVIKEKLEKTDIPDANRERLIEIIDTIRMDAKKHAQAFAAMEERVRWDTKDVF